MPLEGWSLRSELVFRNAIAATRVHVELDDKQDHVHRHLRHVVEILEAGDLPPQALEWALLVFQKLAESEAKAHRTSIEKVHFHEVGAVDAIVDIAGACFGLHRLQQMHDITGFRTSQSRVGRGTVKTQHGKMPVPAPATLTLLQGFHNLLNFRFLDQDSLFPLYKLFLPKQHLLLLFSKPLLIKQIHGIGVLHGLRLIDTHKLQYRRTVQCIWVIN